jgi:hypothetical protein
MNTVSHVGNSKIFNSDKFAHSVYVFDATSNSKISYLVMFTISYFVFELII